MSGRAPDRTVTAVASQRPALLEGRARQAGLVAIGVAAAAMVVVGLYALMHDDGPATKPMETGSTQIGQTVANPPDPIVVAKTDVKTVTKSQTTPKADPEPAPLPFQAAQTHYVIFPTIGGGSFDVPPPAKEDKAGGAAGGAGPEDKLVQTKVAFQPTTMAGGKAGPALRLTYVMMPQVIPCALDTAMDSTLAGPILCHTTQDVLSPSHILLLPVGTTVVGNYKNDVHNGQHRLFALTGNAITQEGIPVPLNSPVGDGLGRTGIEGDVDNHYAERFGAAIALTAAQAAMTLGQAALTSGNQTNTNFNFSGGGSSGGIDSLAAEILRQQGSIPPTISVPPGAIVSIVIDHPIDFSEALRVEIRQ